MSTITLPSGVEVEEGRVLVLPGASTIMPVGDLTPAEVQDLRDEIAAILNLTIGDLADVDTTGLNSGKILVRRSGVWVVEDPSTSIEVVWSQLGTNVPNVKNIYFRNGLTTVAGGAAGLVTVEPIFAGSGSGNTIARANHLHPPTLKNRITTSMGGAVLSGGTASLVDYTAVGLIPGVIYDVDVTGKIECVNSNSSGRLNLNIQIADNPAQVTSRGFSGGVWSEASADGSQMSVTGVSSLRMRFWAEYQSGDPTAMYTGYITYRIEPRGGQT